MATVSRMWLGQVVLPDWHPRAADETCQLFGFVVDHPDGLIVYDTGCGADNAVIDDLYAPSVVPLVDALNDAGHDERNVMAIVNSHLHFDHCGQNAALPNVPVWVQQDELATAANTEFYTVPEWAEIGVDRRRFGRDGEEIASGVRLLHTPGHTPGHQSLAIETVAAVGAIGGDGPTVLAGQPCYTCAELDRSEVVEADLHDGSLRTAYAESLTRLRSLRPAELHLSHDPTAWVPGRV